MSIKLLVNLGDATRIPLGEGRQFRVGADMIAVFRGRDGAVFATQALCSHKSGPLADGIVGNGKVVCPMHAYSFDLGTGRPMGHNCAALTTFDASINEEGEIVVDIEKLNTL